MHRLESEFSGITDASKCHSLLVLLHRKPDLLDERKNQKLQPLDAGIGTAMAGLFPRRLMRNIREGETSGYKISADEFKSDFGQERYLSMTVFDAKEKPLFHIQMYYGPSRNKNTESVKGQR